MSEHTTQHFTVSAGSFNGPLDLLLGLVERRKMHISDVSLSAVTDDYIAYIRELERFPVSHIANFVVTASTLMLIKARSLLPSLDISDGERGDIGDLAARLKLLQTFRQIAERFIVPEFGRRVIRFRRAAPLSERHFLPPASGELTTERLRDAMRGVIATLPREERLPQAAVKKIQSLEEIMTKLVERIQKSLSLSFRDVSRAHAAHTREGRIGIILGFLAILELVKRGAILVRQRGIHADITIECTSVATPNYG